MFTHPQNTKLLRRIAGVLVVAALLTTFLWFSSFETLLSVMGAGLLCPQLLLCFPGVWWRRAERPPSPWDHVATRTPVWSALSELYLDNELDERDLQHIAKVLTKSGYSVYQLEEILYREVHPVLFTNLVNVAGEWAGFDTEWLVERILLREGSELGIALVPAKWLVHASWQEVRALVAATTTPRAGTCALPPANDDLASRVPVWAALSDLYANIGLDEADFVRIAEALAPSRYDVAQLDEILYREVHPVLVWSAVRLHFDPLLLPGELGPFLSDWLSERILGHLRRGPHVTLVPTRWLTRWDWKRIRALVEAMRARSTSP